MSRIDKYLDGGIDPATLTPDERTEADRIEAVIDATRNYVAARPEPDVSESVMRRIQESGLRPGAARVGLLQWLIDGLWTARPVSFQVRPAYALAGMALLVTLVGIWPSRPQTSEGAAVESSTAALQVLVQFRLEAPTASDVRLAGSFTNWEPRHPLHEAAPGLWTVTLPLPIGLHDYAFVVDGQQWVADPYALHVDDGFGGTSSRLALMLVGGPQT